MEISGTKESAEPPPAPSFVRRGKPLIDFYIPHRDKEGYGLHAETVRKLKERGTQLIITVDCGIASVEEIALARELGMDVLVIDHHQFGEVLPQAILVHPGLPDENYPFKKLAAVGVAYKFACALLDEARQRGADISMGWEKWLLDLVAIATVTDMMPLLNENRVLEKYGLTVLNKTRRPGLLALIESAGLKSGELNTEDVGFALGPRLNAAGRMEHAELALRLLLSAAPDEAKSLAADLERCNRDRQDAVRQMLVQAEEYLATNYSLLTTNLPPVLVLWDERWSPSLVGLLAGKFFDRFGRPTVVVGKHEEKWIGSGRSFAGYDITAAMRAAGEGLLTRCGGHIQACGFALSDPVHLPVLAGKLAAHGSAALAGDDLAPLLDIEHELPLHWLGEDLAADLAKLEPFGEANRRPLFVARRCPIVAVELVGSTKTHLRLTFVNEQGKRVRGIGFKMGDRLAEAVIGVELDIVYHVQVHEWNGRREIECKLVDFAKSKEESKIICI